MIFTFVSNNPIKSGVCDVERYGNLIIVTELKENKVISITNAIDAIATQYAWKYDMVMSDMVVIERYDHRSYDKRTARHKSVIPNLSLVKFKITERMGCLHMVSPTWEFISDDVLRVLRWAHSQAVQ